MLSVRDFFFYIHRGTSPSDSLNSLRSECGVALPCRGARPLSELRSLRSLRPLPTPSSSSLRSDSLSPGPSPCPCPGVDRSSRGWLLAACLEEKLLGAEDAVTGITEAGDNVGVVV